MVTLVISGMAKANSPMPVTVNPLMIDGITTASGPEYPVIVIVAPPAFVV
jgi:hypothetical protein